MTLRRERHGHVHSRRRFARAAFFVRKNNDVGAVSGHEAAFLHSDYLIEVLTPP